MAQGACYAQPYDKLRRNIRIEGETMRKDHVGRITPRLNKFPYRYVYVRSRCKFTRDLRRAWRRRVVAGGGGGKREWNRIGGRRGGTRRGRERHVKSIVLCWPSFCRRVLRAVRNERMKFALSRMVLSAGAL